MHLHLIMNDETTKVEDSSLTGSNHSAMNESTLSLHSIDQVLLFKDATKIIRIL